MPAAPAFHSRVGRSTASRRTRPLANKTCSTIRARRGIVTVLSGFTELSLVYPIWINLHFFKTLGVR
jgi:hypothetical protein